MYFLFSLSELTILMHHLTLSSHHLYRLVCAAVVKDREKG